MEVGRGTGDIQRALEAVRNYGIVANVASETSLQKLPRRFFFCNPILFAVCTSTFSKLCVNVYSGM
jgi:hypothetical protein